MAIAKVTCILSLQYKVGDFFSNIRPFHKLQINPRPLKWPWREGVCVSINNGCPRVFHGKQINIRE